MKSAEKKDVTRAVRKFDYAALPDAARGTISLRTQEIRDRMGRAAQNIVEIGQRLIEVKGMIEHGQFGHWLEAEFSLSEASAKRMMAAAEWADEKLKTLKLSDLRIDPSAMYLLSSPSTPDEVQEQFIEQAAAGEPVKHAEVKAAVAAAKPPKSKSRNTTTKASAPAPAPKPTEALKEPTTAPPPPASRNESKTPPVMLDETEWQIPDRLREVFEDRQLYNKLATAITAIKQTANELRQRKSGYFTDAKFEDIEIGVRNLRRLITGECMPHALCRNCVGAGSKGCIDCDKQGWLAQFRFEQTTPKELLAMKPPKLGKGKAA